jgi:glycosyltransferase involved in cell wall biosynthesis
MLMVTPYFPPEGGGLERYAKTIGMELAAHFGWRVVFVASGRRGNPITVTDEDGFRIYRLPTQISASRTPLSARWPKMLRKIAYDEKAVLINAHAPVPGLSDAVAAMGGLVPFVLTYHAGPMHKGKLLQDRAIWMYEQTVMRYTVGQSDAIICNSSYVRDVFARDFVGKAAVIPPGVDSSVYRPGQSGQPGRVIFVAQMDVGMEFKGLDLLLKATKALVDVGVEITVEVVGSGVLMEAYQRFAIELGLGPERVQFSGYLDVGELVSAYQRASVATLPSGNESFGMSLAEAMACGLPVVASRTGGIPDVVEDGVTGLLVTHGAVDELADALRRVIEDPVLAAKFGAAGRHRIETEFDWGVRARATHEVFERTLHAHADATTARAHAKVTTPTVAIVTPRYPPAVGGVERYSSQIAEGLQASGSLQPLVITTRPGWRTTYEYRNGVPVVRFGTWFKISNTPVSPMWPYQVRRILRSRKVALVNAHSPVPVLADAAVAVAGRAPVVVTYHSGSMRKGAGGFTDFGINVYERFVLPHVLSKAAGVVVVSPTTLVSGRAGVKLVPPGVDLDLFTFAEPAARPPLRLLFVGRLDGSATWKGERILFEAVELIARQMPDVRLEIVGDGDGRPGWVAAVAQQGVTDRVDFSGALLGEDLVAAYHRATMVVLPSTTEAESFGMCLIEGMACGRPVIGSRIGGIPFVINHGIDGLLVPPADPQALASAIIELAGDPERLAAMGARGRQNVEARFSVAGLQATYEKLFKDLLP